MKKRSIVSALLIIALLLSAMGALGFAQTPDNAQGYVPDQILVKFLPGTPEKIKSDIHGRLGGSVVGVIPGIDVQVVKIPKNKVDEKVRAYLAEASIRFAEPDYIVKAILTPNDAYFANQWGMVKIQAPEAWGITQGSSDVKVAILDTGIDQNHEDLAAKIVANKNFTTSTTVDDKYGHGTHVAGIAAAITNNSRGVAGAGFNSSLMNVKVLGDNGSGYYSWIANGIIWAADNGAKVINLSLGGTSGSSTLESAVNYAWGKGAVLVAAAGNDNTASPLYPAYYTNVVAVAATDQDDGKASFSNYGSWVDIAAPGVDIFSTLPNHTNRIGILNYGSLSGTSMATPHVAGVAALVWASEHGTDNSSVRNRIEGTADASGTIWSVYGIKRINAYNAVATSSPNAAPVANDDTYAVDEDTALIVAAPGVLGDDTDADGDLLTTVLVSATTHGTLTLNADGSFAYTPAANYNGPDSFTYKAYDGRAYSNEATVSLTVNAVNDTPVAYDDNAATDQDTPVTINVLANDSDIDGDALTVTNLTQPASGVATINADQTVTYTPNTGFVGNDTFTYTANDGKVDSNFATVSITVQEPAPPAPTAVVSITMSKQVVSKWWRATALVTVTSSGSPLDGATLYGKWSGVYSAQVSGTTASDGTVSFKTGFIRQSGTATFTVTRIVKNGQEYTLSGETSDSISGP